MFNIQKRYIAISDIWLVTLSGESPVCLTAASWKYTHSNMWGCRYVFPETVENIMKGMDFFFYRICYGQSLKSQLHFHPIIQTVFCPEFIIIQTVFCPKFFAYF